MLSGTLPDPGGPINTAARAYLSATPSIGVGWQVVPLDTIDFDAGGCFDTATHAYTVPADGVYAVAGSAALLLENNPQAWTIGVWKPGVPGSGDANSGFEGQKATVRGGTAGDAWHLPASGLLKCVAGDSFTLQVYNGGGNSIGVQNGFYATWMSIARAA